MKKLSFKPTPISNLKTIEHKPLQDFRGSFKKLFCQNLFQEIINIKQINHSITKEKGTLRGLHFQYSPYSETKIVSCLRGKVFDVAVDLRKGSSTFLHYHAELLTDYNNKSYFIPEGFAHGFQTLTSNCEMLYFHTNVYNEKYEGVVNAIDPKIKINWPEKITNISERDKKQTLLTNDFEGLI